MSTVPGLLPLRRLLLYTATANKVFLLPPLLLLLLLLIVLILVLVLLLLLLLLPLPLPLPLLLLLLLLLVHKAHKPQMQLYSRFGAGFNCRYNSREFGFLICAQGQQAHNATLLTFWSRLENSGSLLLFVHKAHKPTT